MDRRTLALIDEDLDSSEVEELCFLCQDVVKRKGLEGIKDARELFLRLEDKGLLDNNVFLYQLLNTIRRPDLLQHLETDSRRPEETDASPILSDYRVMLYRIYEEMTKENLEKMKFLLSNKMGKKLLEDCNTALGVFAEMERLGLLSKTNLHELDTVLMGQDQKITLIVQRYKEGINQQRQTGSSSHVSMEAQRINNSLQSTQVNNMSIAETEPSYGEEPVYSDAQPNTESSSHHDEADYYNLSHIPRGVCMIINNEDFSGKELRNRKGTQEDANSLQEVFTRLGFEVVIHKNLTAYDMQYKLNELGAKNFLDEDALVVCVLSHGEKGIVYGTDEKPVSLQKLTQPFKSGQAITLAGKPKLFFIQACQGSDYQKGSLPCPPKPREVERNKQNRLEEDAGRIDGETVPCDADFLLGMATVPDCKSFRSTLTGSIYIQELCRQLKRSAESSKEEDILDVLTRVNRAVSKGVYLDYKQMPEPKYTLTKKLVLKYV
ncbi:hypothetical protein PAMA_005399 [Pampus argenteus]